MLIPSLPPDLKPSMIRPRAGQRNSGDEPDASACSAVAGALALAAFGSTLPVGVSSTAGFFPAAGAPGSALAISVFAGAEATLSDEALSFDLSAVFSPLLSADFDFSSALVFLPFARSPSSFEATSARFALAERSESSATARPPPAL